MRLLTLALALALGLSAAPARAGLIAQYDLQSANAATSLTVLPTFQAPGVTASSLSAGPDLTPVDFAGAYVFSGWLGRASLTRYIGFTLTPDAGQAVTLESISYRMAVASNDPVGPRNWLLFASTDGFVNDFTQIDSFDTMFGGFTRNVSLVPVASLTGPLEFRLFGAAPDDLGSFGGLAYDSEFPDPPGISIYGSVAAVPEPSTLLTAWSGLAAAIGIRSRRRRAVA